MPQAATATVRRRGQKAPRKPEDPVIEVNDDGDEFEMTADEITIARRGQQIVLPPQMSYDEAIIWCRRKKEEEESVVGIHHIIECFPLDGALAFAKAIERTYGWSGKPKYGDKVLISMQTSLTESVQVPWGDVQIPGIEGTLTTGLDPRSQIPKFLIQGSVKKKNEAEVHKLYELTKKIVAEESVYRNKAIRVDFSYIRDGRRFNPIDDAPKFIDISGTKENDLIFEKTTERIIRMTLFSLIEKAPLMRQYGVPLKKGVLLAGKYGTGKTMTANVTALKATRNNFTFVYLKDVRDLAQGLRFAAQYGPSVLFSEDIDRATEGGRTTEVDAILNTLDGVDTKGAEIITVLTTNYLDKVEPAMLRPGRLDAIVPINEPDKEAAARLIQIYGRGLLASDFDFEKAGAALAGNIPAVIRECVERAKVAAIDRCDGKIEGNVIADDVLTAVDAMNAQIKMLTPPPTDNRHPLVRGFEAMGKEIGQSVEKVGANGNGRH